MKTIQELVGFLTPIVKRDDLIPATAHIVIQNNHLQYCNGIVTISSPVVNIPDCKPNAFKFITAIKNAKKEIEFSYLKEEEVLLMKSGRLKVNIPCDKLEHEYPIQKLEGDVHVGFEFDLNEIFNKLFPFITDDAFRIVFNSLLINNDTLYVTLNPIVLEYKLDYNFNTFSIVGREVIKYLLKIKQKILVVYITNRKIAFVCDDDIIVYSPLLEGEYPNVADIIDKYKSDILFEIDNSLFEGVDALKDFSDYKEGLTLTDREILTPNASFELNQSNAVGNFRAELLQLIAPIASKYYFHKEVSVCYFTGENVRGILLGLN